MPTAPPTFPVFVDSPKVRLRAFGRVRRWAAATDPRVVRRLWPVQPGWARRALCPSCGVPLRDGMLLTLNQRARVSPPGPASRALATGDVAALTPALPIEPGELWCVVCLPCLEAPPRLLEGLTLTERLHAVVDAVLRGD